MFDPARLNKLVAWRLLRIGRAERGPPALGPAPGGPDHRPNAPGPPCPCQREARSPNESSQPQRIGRRAATRRDVLRNSPAAKGVQGVLAVGLRLAKRPGGGLNPRAGVGMTTESLARGGRSAVLREPLRPFSNPRGKVNSPFLAAGDWNALRLGARYMANPGTAV